MEIVKEKGNIEERKERPNKKRWKGRKEEGKEERKKERKKVREKERKKEGRKEEIYKKENK